MQAFRLDSHTYDGRYMFLHCTQEQMAAENKSVIHWVLTVEGGNANYYTTGPTTVKIDGQTVYYAPTAYWNDRQFPAGKGSVSGSLELRHREDGSRQVECTLETSIYTGVLRTAKATWELDANPRASTVGATDLYIGSTCMVLIDRKNNAYTHTVALYTDDLEGYLQSDGTLASQPAKLESTTLALIVPLSFYEKIPNERRLSCRLVCTTYLEDTQIGQPQECTFQAICREEDCAPYVAGEVMDLNGRTVSLTGDPVRIVRFFSTAGCSIYARAKLGATLTGQQVNGTPIPGEHIELPNAETGTFVFQVTDSRGYRGEHTVENPLIPYIKLTAKATTHRQAPTSDRVELTVAGDWWAGNFGAEENALTAKCRVGQVEIPLSLEVQEGRYTATVTLEGLSYDRAHLLAITVEDKLMVQSLTVTVNPGVPVFDWGQGDFAFHVPVILADGSAAVSYTQLQQILGQMKGEST